jgi:SAM-dependent methyltransferase
VSATPYDHSFFSGISAGSRRSATRVLPIVQGFAEIGSILDVGCGAGAWLNSALRLGVPDVLGVDGTYVDLKQLEIPQQRFIAADLAGLTPAALRADPRVGARRFDLVMSLEVAEHLGPEHAAAFVDLLCDMGPLVLFSAAIPYQGGTDHRNEQWPSYWAELFAKRGFVAIDAIRGAIWDDTHVEWWYRQNTLLYASAEALERSPSLAQARAATREGGLNIIHPAHYQRMFEWGMGLLRRLNAPPKA